MFVPKEQLMKKTKNAEMIRFHEFLTEKCNNYEVIS